MTTQRLVLLVSLAFTLFYNVALFRNLLNVYGAGPDGWLMVAIVSLVLTALTALVLAIICHRVTVRPVLVLLVLVAAGCSYFMDSFNVVIDYLMIQNVVETDAGEIRDLITLLAIAYFFVLGVLPAVWIWRVPLQRRRFLVEAMASLKTIGVSLVVVVTVGLAFGSDVATFLREHKSVRYYANPLTVVWSTSQFVQAGLAAPVDGTRQPIALDATSDRAGPRKLMILVVGETARGDHFSLNGYERKTNPELSDHDVVSFRHVTSCGTTTAYSLPCMFDSHNADAFEPDEARSTENLLDVLARAGVEVLWRDNNSDSKGVAVAIPYEDYKRPDVNPLCDAECRDEGMLADLSDYIASASGDVLIVLHQMGNHGPAYYKRYPAEYERFVPACHTTELGDCEAGEIVNAYDNAILFTDHFLAKTIEFLQPYDGEFDPMLLYASDHGESLGEKGLYLHGMPLFMAPKEQREVAMMFWSPRDRLRDQLRAEVDMPLSHDNLFHTVLGLMNVRTQLYDPALDFSALAQEPSGFAD